MGPVESTARPFMEDPYYIVDTEEGSNGNINLKPETSSFVVANRVVKNVFWGIWSMHCSESVTPDPRASHFTVNFPQSDVTMVGYGLNKDNNLLNDIWIVNHGTRKWMMFNVDKPVSPRNGTTATVIGDYIWLFGGFQQGTYLQDLHVINIRTRELTFPVTTGEMPPPRVGHVMVNYGKNIYIWGGYNGDWLNDIYVLDTETLAWRKVFCQIKGRTSVGTAVVGNILYIFGCSRTDGLLKFNFTTEVMSQVKVSGTEPPTEITGSSFIPIGKYLILIGGKKKDRKYQLIYGFDTEKDRWFIFHIVPDGITVNYSDGSTTKEGLFQTPCVSGASSFYRERSREIIVFLGVPHVNPIMFFCIDIANALGFLNLQSDLLQQLRK
jgi:hypothetical protein